MMQKDVTSVRIKVSTKERLDKYRHPGQSVDGVVQEVLNLLEKFQKSRQG